MLIVGAKGFAKEVLEVLYQQEFTEEIAFYDDISADIGDFLYGKFRIIRNLENAQIFLANHRKEFTVGVGNPAVRALLCQKFVDIGGVFTSTISPVATIGHFGNQIGEGCNIMSGSVLTNDIRLGRGVLVNLNCTIGHDSVIEDFAELCPGVHVSGNCHIGHHAFIGTGAVLLPGVSVGNNAVVAAGAVVTKDVADKCMVAGIPAQIIKNLA